MRSLKDWWSTLIEALTLRRVIALPIVFATVTAVVHLAPFLAREIQPSHASLGTSSWAFGVVAAPCFTVFFRHRVCDAPASLAATKYRVLGVTRNEDASFKHEWRSLP